MGYFSNYGEKAKSIVSMDTLRYMFTANPGNPAFEKAKWKRTLGYGIAPDTDPKHCIGRLRTNPVIERIRLGQTELTDAPKATINDQSQADALIIVQLSLKSLGLLDADFSKKSWWRGNAYKKPLFGSDNAKSVSWGVYGPRTKAAIEKLQSCANIDPAKGRSGQTIEAETLAALERALAAVAQGKNWSEGCIPVVEAPVAPPPPPTNDEAVVKELLDNMDKIVAAMMAAKKALAKAGCKDDLNAIPEVVTVKALIENGRKIIKDPRIQYDAAKTAEWTGQLDAYQKEIGDAVSVRDSAIKTELRKKKASVDLALNKLYELLKKAQSDIYSITSGEKTEISEVRQQIEALASVQAARAKIRSIDSQLAGLKRSTCLDLSAQTEKLAKYKRNLEDIISGKVGELEGAVRRNAEVYFIAVGMVQTQSSDLYVYTAKLNQIKKRYEEQGIDVTISPVDVTDLSLKCRSLIRNDAVAARAAQIYKAITGKSNFASALNEDEIANRTVGHAMVAILKACAEVNGIKGVVMDPSGSDIRMPIVSYDKIKEIADSL